MMRKKSDCAIFLVTACAALLTPHAFAQLSVSNGEDVNFNFGFQAQAWGDMNQTVTAAGAEDYSQNLYLRRVRLLVGGQVAPNVTFFFQTDSPNLGKTPKALNTGFLVQDAFVEWKALNAFRLDGGLMLVPFSRNGMQSTLSYYTLDISPLAVVNNTATQSSGLRDGGFQARGFLLDNHLQYRAGLFQGERDSNARDSLRGAAYVQYDFFAREMSYTYTGTALGKQKILAVDGGVDAQGSYRGRSGNVAAAIPVFHGDEAGGQFQYFHYDGAQKFPAILNQNGYLAEAAYYSHRIRLQPFGKFESQNFVDLSAQSKDVYRWGGGLNYYVHGQNLKFTAQILRTYQRNLQPANEFTLQFQVFYF
jgi:Phosphate-selective porin O and P